MNSYRLALKVFSTLNTFETTKGFNLLVIQSANVSPPHHSYTFQIRSWAYKLL